MSEETQEIIQPVPAVSQEQTPAVEKPAETPDATPALLQSEDLQKNY